MSLACAIFSLLLAKESPALQPVIDWPLVKRLEAEQVKTQESFLLQ